MTLGNARDVTVHGYLDGTLSEGGLSFPSFLHTIRYGMLLLQWHFLDNNISPVHSHLLDYLPNFSLVLSLNVKDAHTPPPQKSS